MPFRPPEMGPPSRFWKIFYKGFYKKTKIPALLNTSFNIHGEPIVNTIEDALKTFKNSDIDLLKDNSINISNLKKEKGKTFFQGSNLVGILKAKKGCFSDIF